MLEFAIIKDVSSRRDAVRSLLLVFLATKGGQDESECLGGVWRNWLRSGLGPQGYGFAYCLMFFHLSHAVRDDGGAEVVQPH